MPENQNSGPDTNRPVNPGDDEQKTGGNFGLSQATTAKPGPAQESSSGNVHFINIQLQNGPIKENGVNGCQIDDVIRWCRDKLEEFQQKDGGKFHSEMNSSAIHYLDITLHQLALRTKDREARGVEGTSEA